MNAADLNTKFAIDGRVCVVEGPGGLPMIDITTDKAQARISLYAGQVLSFKPTGQSTDLMFLSDTAYYAPGKAIKGGAPICWPWFGPDPEGKGRPGHGFVRNRPWNLLATEELSDGRIQVHVGLHDTQETRAIWDQAFELELCVTISETLDVALITRNTGTTAFALSQALHTYLAVGDIAKAQVIGLDGTTYIDKMDGGVEKVQHGPVKIDGETDRIYTGVSGMLQVEDAALSRCITITPRGSASAVVWNPWAATAASMGDLGDDDYKIMLCVESTNAGPDIIDVAAGGEHSLGVTYALSQL
ncbi:D-hexose-6-phosphate mutarotase [Magnetovibrio blakemorei]|uniref:Putative glucose-6-phosphate 1-epimerase n=1 Tax=Magnetovibrio blakemorei TaxID=28181 RepID=A0A1E5Q342_9PROT|nr:D-hexose-6-phosphate mutarotase [Magnetovibrio blakemorei]OEJ64022.1 D-hexose-6-phosphate mutarotase [Magnetovibrio blakemorei]